MAMDVLDHKSYRPLKHHTPDPEGLQLEYHAQLWSSLIIKDVVFDRWCVYVSIPRQLYGPACGAFDPSLRLEPSCRNLSQPPLVRTSGAHDPPPGHARPLLLTIRVLSPDVTTSAARQKSRNPAFRADGKSTGK
ncbi:hypothetical protein Bbelb_417410 [Branchiostoma belcheri]|nr:hypothetical protein Bbelb_417410 [Branchiostoma belcheri]